MASKRRTTRHPKVPQPDGSDAKNDDSSPKTTSRTRTKILPEDVRPEAALGPEQLKRLATLLPQANSVIQEIEDRMAALTVAATSRWVPGQDAYDTDENESPAFGDEEYADLLALVEEVAEAAMFKGIAGFFSIPEGVINEVLVEALKTKLVGGPPSQQKRVGVVSHKRHGRPS